MNDVFISFPFEERFNAVFQMIQDAVSGRGFNAIRIDHSLHIADEPIAVAIQRRIRESRLVIADITGNNSNVLNEIGLAQAFGKPLVLITQDRPSTASFNVRGLPILTYDIHNLAGLWRLVERALREATSPNETLRAMLVPSSLGRPTRESWFVIAASPLSFRRATGRAGGFKELRRTSSDYVGIRGLLQAFGLLYGFEALPDVVDPEDCDDVVLRKPMNLYCIASPKANQWTRKILGEYQQQWAPRIEFRVDPISKNLQNPKVSIFSDDGMVKPTGWKVNVEGDRYYRDFGLIVRGPNPHDKDLMVTIMAGRSSLGTQAACTAFTDPDAIPQIRQHLGGLEIDLEDHKQPFWAIVSMKRARGDQKEEARRETLKIEHVAQFRRL